MRVCSVQGEAGRAHRNDIDGHDGCISTNGTHAGPLVETGPSLVAICLEGNSGFVCQSISPEEVAEFNHKV